MVFITLTADNQNMHNIDLKKQGAIIQKILQKLIDQVLPLIGSISIVAILLKDLLT